MRLVFLWGLPGSGKLTVAKEVAALTGWKVFHNHLTVDLLLAVFPFGSKEFVELREQIWLSVFEAAAKNSPAGLLFTFNPENTVRQRFIDDTVSVVAKQGGRVEFVEMFCEELTLEKRLDAPDRRAREKLVSVGNFASCGTAACLPPRGCRRRRCAWTPPGSRPTKRRSRSSKGWDFPFAAKRWSSSATLAR